MSQNFSSAEVHGWASAEQPRNVLTLICSFVTSGTFRGSGIITQKPNKGMFSRFFEFL